MGYNRESLEQNILKAKKNIQTFEDAISAERETIKKLQHYMDVMDEQERTKKKIKENVHIEIERENG
jgi:hypothetical protein